MSLRNLENNIKAAMDERIRNESRALRGTVKDGRFYCGNRSYPYESAVETKTSNGTKLWAQKTQNNSVVIIGE